MVVIRLSRGGSKARPFFNIVVADKRVRRDGAWVSTTLTPVALKKACVWLWTA